MVGQRAAQTERRSVIGRLGRAQRRASRADSLGAKASSHSIGQGGYAPRSSPERGS